MQVYVFLHDPEDDNDYCIMLFIVGSCLLQWSGGNAFVPAVYDPKVPQSSQCGQSDPITDDQQLMERLKMIHQQLPPPGCNPPPTCKKIFFTATHLPPQATTRSRLLMAQLCRSTVTWLESTVEGVHESGPPQHD